MTPRLEATHFIEQYKGDFFYSQTPVLYISSLEKSLLYTVFQTPFKTVAVWKIKFKNNSLNTAL